MYRVLITGYRKYWNPPLIAAQLDARLSAHPHDLELVLFELWEGPELQVQDWYRKQRKAGHTVRVDLWPINIRAHGRKPDPRVSTAMVESGIDECLAFIDSNTGKPQKLGGMLGVAPLCEARNIPTTRFGRTWEPEQFRPRLGKARRLPEGTYSDKLRKRNYG